MGKQVIWGMKYLLPILVCCLFITAGASAQVPAATIPDFTFYRFNKTAFTKKDITPGKTIFFIFFDTECDHCQHAVQYLEQHHKELGKAAVYMLSLDNKEKVMSFLNKYGKSLPGKKNVLLLRDVLNEFVRKFSPRKYPSLFLYSAQHKLVMYDDDEKKLPDFLSRIKATGK